MTGIALLAAIDQDDIKTRDRVPAVWHVPLSVLDPSLAVSYTHLTRMTATTKRLQRIKEKVALQFGNLTGPTLHLLCEDLVRHLRPGGVLIGSGILSLEADGVIQAFTERGLVLIDHQKEEEWSGILLLKPNIVGKT